MRLFKSTFTSAADKEATVLVLQKVDLCQGKVECQRTHMMLHFISFEAQANMILEDFIFDGIVDGVPQPDAIIIPFSVTTVEREEGTGLDNLLRGDMHPINKQIFDVADVMEFLTWLQYANLEHIMWLGAMELLIKHLIDADDVDWSKNCFMVLFSNGQIFEMDVMKPLSFG